MQPGQDPGVAAVQPDPRVLVPCLSAGQEGLPVFLASCQGGGRRELREE